MLGPFVARFAQWWAALLNRNGTRSGLGWAAHMPTLLPYALPGASTSNHRSWERRVLARRPFRGRLVVENAPAESF